MSKAVNGQELLTLEESCLLILCGPTRSGKSHFARRWFRETEIVSLDHMKQLVFDRNITEHDSPEAESLLLSLVEHRLNSNRLTVVDACCLRTSLRRSLVHLARHFQMPVYLMLMDTSQRECEERLVETNKLAKFRLQSQFKQMQTATKMAGQEGYSKVYRFSEFGPKGPLPLRQPLPVWSKERGPFDLIGDIHGCYDELVLLLEALGYQEGTDKVWRHPEGRKVLFLGDLVDRGPQSIPVVELATAMHEAGQAIYIPGNHCDKFARYLRGSNVMIGHGLETTVAEVELLDTRSRDRITKAFLSMFDQALPYLLLDEGRLVVAHAGLPENFHGRMSQRIRAFSLFGEVTGKTDAHGRPIRRDWAQDYAGKPLVVYGHTPVLYPRFVNNCLNLDQGCVFGGVLSAMRYPEREIVSVPAKYIYWRPQ